MAAAAVCLAHSITRRLFLRPKSSLRNAFVVETVFVKRSRRRQVGEWVGLTLISAILGWDSMARR